MPNKEFLEKSPLYRKFKSELKFYRAYNTGIPADDMPKPAIHMYCSDCDSEQTYNMTNEYYVKYANEQISDQVVRLNYVCSSCEKGTRVFLIHFIPEKVDSKNEQSRLLFEKVGQIPAWDIQMDKNLEVILGEHATLYRQGLVCESQSYGIGAYAYFRRITENIIDELLESISDLLHGEEKTKYAEALVVARKTKVTQEKINLVKDLLPISLRPNGLNPLEALHSALSEGLHAEDDESCLEYADAIKEVLVYLVNQVIKAKADAKKFTAGMQKLLDKKAKAGIVKKEESGNI